MSTKVYSFLEVEVTQGLRLINVVYMVSMPTESVLQDVDLKDIYKSLSFISTVIGKKYNSLVRFC